MGHTRYSGCKVSPENMDFFGRDQSDKVVIMSNFSYDNFFADSTGSPRDDQFPQTDPANENPTAEEDMLMEQILENINATPIGQVLKRIASLPEISREKILNVRRQITEGNYDLNERLDVALEKVLEDLIV
jgi:hypothetical protein